VAPAFETRDDGVFPRTESSDGVALLQVTAFRSGGAYCTCTNDIRQVNFRSGWSSRRVQNTGRRWFR
jgi:hypothetical protein